MSGSATALGDPWKGSVGGGVTGAFFASAAFLSSSAFFASEAFFFSSSTFL